MYHRQRAPTGKLSKTQHAYDVDSESIQLVLLVEYKKHPSSILDALGWILVLDTFHQMFIKIFSALKRYLQVNPDNPISSHKLMYVLFTMASSVKRLMVETKPRKDVWGQNKPFAFHKNTREPTIKKLLKRIM